MPTYLSLDRGVQAEVLTDAPTGASGTTYSKKFSIPPVGPFPTVQFSYTGAPTALDGKIQTSTDGGTTFRDGPTFDLATNKTWEVELQPGTIYRISLTTCTIGGGATVDILATLR